MIRKRVFLVLLVLFLLLATMANQHVQNPAALISNDKVLGFIPLWQLINVLPAGIFAAGVCAVAIGMGAEFWRALLPLCGARWLPAISLSRLADAGLWCGWVTLATCITSLGRVFPWSVGEPGAYGPGLTPTSFFDVEHYLLVLQICGAVMILTRILAMRLRQKAALPIVILTSAAALVCGQFWCRALPISYLSICLLLPWGCLLLWQPSKLSVPQLYMTIAALGVALYGLNFEHTIGRYVIDVSPPDIWYSIHRSIINSALPLLALLLALLLRPLGIMHKAAVKRLLSLLILFCGLQAIWHLVAAGAVGTQITQQLPLSIACYVAPLLCVSGLFTLRLQVTSVHTFPEKQEN